MKLSFKRQERALTAKTVAEVLLAYFAIALLVLGCGYFFPQEGERVSSVPIVVSVALLLPFYVWYRGYRDTTELSKEIKKRDKGTVLFWILALFILALVVRVPSVLLFNAPYEKTPLILLTILVILVIEKTDISAFGFTTKRFGKSLAYGLLFFLILNLLTVTILYVLMYVITGQMAFQSYDLGPFVSAMPFMTLCVGISEEGLFRGYMQTHLDKLYTPRKAVLIQALLFGAWHSVWNLSPFNPFAMAQYVAITFIVGLLFGYFYSKARNLTPLIFAHGLWDSVPQGIVESSAASSAFSLTPPMTQILVVVLPYVITVSLTIVFVKYLVRRTDGT
jgi:membrane protease YdiL (CAAX protease family)